MLKRIPLNRIHRNEDQPRQHFDQRSLEELADSIAENGLLQPITVRPHDGGYQIVAGERRYRAALILRDRGQAAHIMANVQWRNDEAVAVSAILENLQREGVTPLEEAAAYQRMIDHFGYTPATLAKKLGLKRPFLVTDKTRLLNLTEDKKDLLRRGVINFAQASAMATLDPQQQEEMLQIIKAGGAKGTTAADRTALAIQRRDAQGRFFSEAEAPKARARDEEQMSRIEKAIEAATAAVAKCFDDGELTIAGQLDPARFEKAAQRAKLLRKHLAQIEAALGHGGTVARLSLVTEAA